MADVLVIGGGPAGSTAALYALRGGAAVTLLYRDRGALERAERIENFYGFPGGISGKELFDRGLRAAEELGATLVPCEVLSLSFEEKLTAVTDRGVFTGDAVILAAGASRTRPKLEGFDRLDGSGVSFCAVCDAFLHRGEDVAVLGNGPYARHEAEVLLPLCRSVTLLTDGAAPACEFPREVRIDPAPLAALVGEDRLTAVRFADGRELEITALFAALGVAGSTELARKLGAVIGDGRVAVDVSFATNVPGVFAAGDCVGGLAQVSKAVRDGAEAGLSALRYLRKGQKS